MKLLVGIDSTKRHEATLDLVARLQFKQLSLDLVTVVPTIETYAWMYPAYSVVDYAGVTECLESGARMLLDQASDDACRRSLKAEAILMTGGKAEGLSTAADQYHADMIAVASGPKGPLDRLLSGSLAQSLAIAAHQSVLVVRGEKRSHGPVNAVFATDHSKYADLCLDRLLSWHLCGLDHVTVLTAHEPGAHHPDLEEGREAAILDQIRTKTEAVARRFRDAGVSATALTVQSNVHDAVHDAMAHAELLILGARGHGFWDRVLLGSVAMHQVGTAPYSILLIREPSHEVACTKV